MIRTKNGKITSQYTRAVLWIAQNDSAGDQLTTEQLSGFLTVQMIADLFDVGTAIVAKDVDILRRQLKYQTA